MLVDREPEEIVRLVDWRYLSDALTPEEALSLLRARREVRIERESTLWAEGYPVYTTSAGWLNCTDEKVAGLASEAVTAGFTKIKLKVGATSTTICVVCV